MCFVVNVMLLVIKYVSILVKIKCVNFGNTTDICDKHNFTIKYTYFTIIDTYLLKHTYFIKINTVAGPVTQISDPAFFSFAFFFFSPSETK